MTVRGQLNAIRKTFGQVIHEMLRVPCVSTANTPARNNLGIRTNRRPRPDITEPKLTALLFRNVLVLGVAERPNFVTLNSLALEVAENLVLEVAASRTDLGKQLYDGVLARARHSHGRSDSQPFTEALDYCGSLLVC
jgi:hypothetical protein